MDSITTSAGQEDHVSMGGCSARKALTVVEHVESGDRHCLLGNACCMCVCVCARVCVCVFVCVYECMCL